MAGGKSEKLINVPSLILWMSFFGSGGRPAPMGTRFSRGSELVLVVDGMSPKSQEVVAA